MRRENRKKNSNSTIYITAGVLFAAVAAFIVMFVVYSNKLDEELYSLDSEYLAEFTSNVNSSDEIDNNVEAETASSMVGKTVEESKSETEENKIVNTTEESKKEDAEEKNSKSKNTTTVQKDPTFIKPIEGEISKEFAKESLVYSETLKEWTTHLGIDIKAEKATVVKATADGTVKYIKNDPRYGLTIIIEHSNGFQSLYANLLTTDFVSEGEEVKAGQTIGTVGDSSVYEIVDECHLHFEILKNGENLNPTEYVKF